jgi:hypothetical protein
LEASKIGGQIVFNVEYAGDDKVLQGRIYGLLEIIRCHGVETNVGNTKVMRISMQPSKIRIMIHLIAGERGIF